MTPSATREPERVSYAEACRDAAEYFHYEAGGCMSPDCYGHPVMLMRERAARFRALAAICERAEKHAEQAYKSPALFNYEAQRIVEALAACFSNGPLGDGGGNG